MNDRYLFRAKRIDNGEWIVGDLSHHKTGKVFVKPLNGSAISTCEVDEDTICQYTGLKDKNGKLIWENDIVWDSEEREFYQIIFSQEDMCYYMQDADGYKDVFEACYGSSIDIESNIFDNPELMNE